MRRKDSRRRASRVGMESMAARPAMEAALRGEARPRRMGRARPGSSGARRSGGGASGFRRGDPGNGSRWVHPADVRK